MSQPGIFRLAGDGTRISHLTKVFNMPPLYGDSLSISSEPIHNLTGLVKRYVRDMPEPILDESIFPAFMGFCLDTEDLGSPTLATSTPDPNSNSNSNGNSTSPSNLNAETKPSTTARPLAVRIAAAQILLRLLPPSHFSLFIYLLAFLGQLPLFPDNRLNVESISIIFGPAMVASRGRGIAGLGPGSNSSNSKIREEDPERISEMVNNSQSVLGWLLRHWGLISEKVLDSIHDTTTTGGLSSSTSTSFSRDPKLGAPINLKMSSVMSTGLSSSSLAKSASGGVGVVSPFTIPPPPDHDPPSPKIPLANRTPISTPKLSTSANSSSTGHSDTVATPAPNGQSGRPVSPAPSAGRGGGGLFSRAFSSRSISAQANAPNEENKVKRSTSFTSISSMVKKGSGVFMAKIDAKGANFEGESSPASFTLGWIRALTDQLLDHCQLRN